MSAVLYNIGKVGDMENDYYLYSTDKWRIEKLGEIYKINDRVSYMQLADRTLLLANTFGIKLTENESISINSLVKKDDFIIKNFKYNNIKKFPTEQELITNFFDSKLFGKKLNRNLRSRNKTSEFNNTIESLKEVNGMFYVEDVINRKIIKNLCI